MLLDNEGAGISVDGSYHGTPPQTPPIAAVGSAQLTVLAAASVVQILCLLGLIDFLLAGYAEANPWHRLTPGFWNFITTFVTVGQTLSLGQTTARLLNGIAHARIYLILYSAISRPTAGHEISR